MLLHIEPDNGIAIYDQVVRQIKFAVADGAVQSGEMIPSVRELARQLAINPNTVTRAYRQLQDEGVLNVVRGTGLAVAPRAAERCRKQRVDLIRARVRQVLEEASYSGLSLAEIQQLLEEESNRIEPTPRKAQQ